MCGGCLSVAFLVRTQEDDQVLETRKDGDPLTDAFYRQSAREITHYLSNPEANAPKEIAPAWGRGPRSRFPLPPGPPL